MWPSSNMFFKKLITNLCFPRSTQSSNKPSCPPPTSFNTHLSRHFSSTQHVPNNLQTEEHQRYTKNTTTKNNIINATSDEDIFFTSSSTSKETLDHPSDPDFASLIASQRFFFSSPGHSKSLINLSTSNDISRSSSACGSGSGSGPLLQNAGGVPVPKYSPDPYSDFRMSMQEMLEARVKQSNLKDGDPSEKWEYLHQLLTCYLSLNPVNTHECIIMAFSDLLVNFLLDDEKDAGRKKGQRKCSVSRRLL